jgi:RimJ/RimL family protein N-acetyltransferase
MPDVSVRESSGEDASAVRTIIGDDLPQTHRPDVKVAELEGRIAGAAIVRHDFFGHDFIELIVVEPWARRRGVATALVRCIVDEGAREKVFTSTNESNEPMRRLLAVLGWTPVGVISGLDEGDPEHFFVAPTARTAE